ncbi:RHS repeat domain-containing protein [Streptomyces sp. NPDC088560]|uniref:RHS repeat domain-containing protein n=1 Tax=Streptomyces sp. NPDC088560 TaxID=3365868 RepID=UPI00380052A2
MTVLDQKTARAAGIHGVLFTLQRTGAGGGKVALRVDDSSFRYAFGGDFASRLHLVQLPSCALTTPKSPKCHRQTSVRTAPSAPLSAQVSLPGVPSAPAAAISPSTAAVADSMVVMAATSGTSGSSGDYSATSLSPGGSWSTSGNTGSFGYSYPISVPPAIGGAAPKVDLSYDSSSQDTRTEGTNNQSSWIGDGWTSSENYIERTYKACNDDSSSNAPKDDGDECWAGQVLTLSLNGTSTEIVYDDATKTFHPADDDSTTKIENLTDATNGTANGEYFKVTEGGVQYFFGLNRLPGWSSGKGETKSVWTVPVYHAHSGVSACPDSTDFASTSCTLGYRFNLDYAVDTHGNATAWYYTPETGYYGAGMKDTAVAYTRGGTLSRIDYGMTASSIYSGTAPEQILFDTSERCIPGTPSGNTCADNQFTAANAAYWPDVPIDLNCTSGSSCTNHSPSFWSRKRLTSITTQIQTGGATKQVDKYSFTQSFPDGGDHAPTLWLDSIQRTGLDTLGGASGSTSTPAVSFDPPLQLANRVGTIPQMPLMYHDRIQTVTSETGAETTVSYDRPDCSSAPASDPNDPADAAAQSFASTNTLSCFPVYWTPYGQPAPMMDWFYKYKVTSVVTQDVHNAYQDGTEPELETDYAYKGNPGWHFDDNEVVKAKNRTWGQFRGYPEVDVTTGDPNAFHLTDGTKVYDQKTLAKTYYFLGMNGDTLPGGKTRSVPDLTSQDGATSFADDDALAGQTFEADTYTAAGSLDKAVVTVPTIIGPTATRTRSGLTDLTARMVRTAKTLTREAVSYGWRKTETDTFYNTTLGKSTTGMPVQVDDRGETAASGNVAKCIHTHYLTGSVDTLVLPAEVITTAQDCSSAGSPASGTLISDVRTSYDHNAFAYDSDGQQNPTLPKIGDATLVQKASAATGATATAFVDQVATTYDAYGRVTKATRTPNSTSPDGKSLAQAVFGNPTSTTDQQSETGNTVTDQQCYSYDTLDRLTDAWTANDNCAASPPTSSTLTTTAGSYWQSFSYDAIGDRKQSIDHAVGSSGTTATTYTNGCSTACNSTGAQPHTLTATTGSTDPTKFGYDEDGNLHTRTPTTGPGQTLTWDDEGHLAQVDTAGTSPTTTKYLYDADGNQLIRRDPGQTTLFASDTEIVVNTSVNPNVLLGAVRTYVHGGGAGVPIAVRSSLAGGGLKYLFSDPHGTATLAMDATSQQISRQQYTPFGQQRNSPNTTTWPDPTHSYLGKPQDANTGYTDIGARKYDPALGRFISVDPLLRPTSPQELGGYAYAADNPLTYSDPSGLGVCMPEVGCGGVKSVEEAVTKDKQRNPSKYDGIDDITGRPISGKDGTYLFTYWSDDSDTPIVVSSDNPKGAPLVEGWDAPKKPTFFGALFGGHWREAINQLLSTDCGPGTLCDVMPVPEGPLGEVGPAAEAPSKGRLAQESGDSYELELMRKLGGEPGPNGKPGFQVGGRDFDGKYMLPDGSREMWYEAKSGAYWDRANSNDRVMNKFKSNLGSQKRIASENGAEFMVISENNIPANIREFLDKKEVPYAVIPRG